MAALLGTNTAVMLFQGIEQESDPKQIREIALSIIAATLPFQGIYFLIYTYMLENNGKLTPEMTNRLDRASAVCQLVAYLSLVGVGMMWYIFPTMWVYSSLFRQFLQYYLSELPWLQLRRSKFLNGSIT